MPTLDLRPAATEQTGEAPESFPEPAPSGTILAWEAPEYEHRPKTLAWYVAFGVCVALLLFTAFLMRSFLTGAVFGLLGLLVYLFSERLPRTVRFALSHDALIINERRYLLRDLDAFSVVDSLSGLLLLVRSRRVAMPLLHLPLAGQNPDSVRNAFRRILTEDPDLRESLADVLAHRLGF